MGKWENGIMGKWDSGKTGNEKMEMGKTEMGKLKKGRKLGMGKPEMKNQ